VARRKLLEILLCGEVVDSNMFRSLNQCGGIALKFIFSCQHRGLLHFSRLKDSPTNFIFRRSPAQIGRGRQSWLSLGREVSWAVPREPIICAVVILVGFAGDGGIDHGVCCHKS